MPKLIGLILTLAVPAAGLAQTAPKTALFTEDFNGKARLIGRSRQAQTFLRVKYAHNLPGWTRQGADMPAHYVEQYPGNWVFMLVANKAGQNIFTQKEGIAANDKGHTYTVSFDAGPAVYAGLSQATAEGDEIAVELLRADGTVLKKHTVAPGKWRGKFMLENHTFAYQGDGSGPLRFRISPIYKSGVRFFGALEHLQVFGSANEAKAAIARRRKIDKEKHQQTARSVRDGPHKSRTPRFTFAKTLKEQEKQLKTNELMVRFAKSRKRLAADPYRPAYHFVNPESSMNDPNAVIFWQGRWHLFFIAMPPDEFPNPADILKRWHRTSVGHAVSDDLVHWKDLPYAINPGIEKACYSGGMLVEKDRVVAFYPGMGAGQMVAISGDPLLLNWKKQGPVNTRLGDSCIWKEGDTYYGLTGNKIDYIRGAWWPQMEVWATKDLVTWEALGNFIKDYKTPFSSRHDDGACPDFKRIGDKYILSFFSHTNGGQYFLGDYDKKAHRFKPYHHGRFNHGKVAPGGVHAPRMEQDGKGGVINILNNNHGKHSDDWDQVMSLAQRMTLGPGKLIRIEPVAAVASLRGKHQHVAKTAMPANEEIILKGIEGNTMELEVEIDPKNARWVQLSVLRSPNAEEQTSITFYNYDKKLAFWYHTPGVVCLDGSRSSTLSDVWIRPPERAEMRRGGEPLKLRVFIDRSIVEVFANGKQYLAMRVYPGRRDSVGVSVRAQGQEALLKRLDAWQMKAIWPVTKPDQRKRP